MSARLLQANEHNLIPKGTLVKVRLFIRPGGYNDIEMGWTGGYAKRNPATGAVYLDTEYTLLEGPYARRKLRSIIGLHSEKSEQWYQMGRATIKGILNSAFGLFANDQSAMAQARRQLSGFADLDGLVFLAKIDVAPDARYGQKNVIKAAVGPEHPKYAQLMQVNVDGVTVSNATATSAPAVGLPPAGPPAGLPGWAE